MQRMMSGWVGLLAVALVATAAQASENRVVFGPGEQLTYSVKYLGVRAGTAELTVGNSVVPGKEVWPIVLHAKTDSLLAIYPIQDKLVTLWDAGDSCWLGHEFYADENHHRRRQKIELDPHTHQASVMKQKEGEPIASSKRALPDGTMDFASVMFALRDRPLTVGAQYDLPVFTGAKLLSLSASVEGRETLDTELGKKAAVRVRVRTGMGGKFASKHDMIVYFSDDVLHIPLRIEADLALGTVAIELTDYAPGRTVDLKALASSRG